MFFWISVLIGLVLAFVSVRKGFFETIVLFFNTTLSVYVAVFLTPYVVTAIPAAMEIPGGLIATSFLLFFVSFLILFGISFVLFTGECRVPFPRVFDVICSSFLGFGTGFLTSSYLLLMLSLIPVPRLSQAIQHARTDANHDFVCYACDQVQSLIRAPGSSQSAEVMLTWLKESVESHQNQHDNRPADANDSLAASASL